MMIKKFSSVGMLFAGLIYVTSASAGSVVQCGQEFCSANFAVNSGNKQVGSGEFTYDAKTGEISLSSQNITGGGVLNKNGGIMWNLGNGDRVSVNSLSGNADPILNFGLGASTGASGNTYAFAFNLPIALSGSINTASSVSYSLTSTTGAGAQIKGLGGNKILQSWDVDTSVGGLSDLNKNVDVGDTHFHAGGPLTTNSLVFSDTDSIIGDLAYDLMAVQVAFSLSANSSVGISGFVAQTPVPLPAAGWLMIAGLGSLVSFRRNSASDLKASL